METVELSVYRFDELVGKAKEKARQWYREGVDRDGFWYECIFDDFEQICGIIGIELKQQQVRLMSGKCRSAPCIWFSGFWSQGDGACFEGTWTYAKGAARKIREYAPQDAALHLIADALCEAQRRNFYQLRAVMRHSGHYYHSGCMTVDVDRDEYRPIAGAAESVVTDAMRALADWLYRTLQTEYEYQTSDTVIDEEIEANEYRFTADGAVWI